MRRRNLEQMSNVDVFLNILWSDLRFRFRCCSHTPKELGRKTSAQTTTTTKLRAKILRKKIIVVKSRPPIKFGEFFSSPLLIFFSAQKKFSKTSFCCWWSRKKIAFFLMSRPNRFLLKRWPISDVPLPTFAPKRIPSFPRFCRIFDRRFRTTFWLVLFGINPPESDSKKLTSRSRIPGHENDSVSKMKTHAKTELSDMISEKCLLLSKPSSFLGSF